MIVFNLLDPLPPSTLLRRREKLRGEHELEMQQLNISS